MKKMKTYDKVICIDAFNSNGVLKEKSIYLILNIAGEYLNLASVSENIAFSSENNDENDQFYWLLTHTPDGKIYNNVKYDDCCEIKGKWHINRFEFFEKGNLKTIIKNIGLNV